MRKRIKYTDEPIHFEVTKDFLPPPDAFALKEENIRVTITLSKTSVQFFKKYAKKTHSHYQTMIRRILDHYAAQYQ